MVYNVLINQSIRRFQMGVNMGSGFESADLRGEVLDLSDLEGDFDCLSCEDDGIILYGIARGEACTCEAGRTLGIDADYESMDGDFDSGMASAGCGTDEDYGYYGDDEGW
jgi:hypothetical protein